MISMRRMIRRLQGAICWRSTTIAPGGRYIDLRLRKPPTPEASDSGNLRLRKPPTPERVRDHEWSVSLAVPSRSLIAGADVWLFVRRRRAGENAHFLRKTQPTCLLSVQTDCCGLWETGVGECADSDADQVRRTLRLPEDR